MPFPFFTHTTGMTHFLQIPDYTVFRSTATFDIRSQIAVKDSGAIQGFDATSKFRVQNSITCLDLHLGQNIIAEEGGGPLAISLTSTRLYGSKI